MNVNEASSIEDQAFDLDENSPPGSVVGTVSAGDPDVGASLSFASTGASGVALFDISSASPITVAPGALLHYEAVNSHTLDSRRSVMRPFSLPGSPIRPISAISV